MAQILRIHDLPGGHPSTSEHPDLLAGRHPRAPATATFAITLVPRLAIEGGAQDTQVRVTDS